MARIKRYCGSYILEATKVLRVIEELDTYFSKLSKVLTY